MPAPVDNTPEKLRQYVFHGIDLQYREGDKEAVAQCPWCGRENKFSVNISTGQWRCLVCNEGEGPKGVKGGNAVVFMRRLWELSLDSTKLDDYAQLAEDRKILPATLKEWGLAKSILTYDWLVPASVNKPELSSLYRYVDNGKRMLLMPTPTRGHHLFGRSLFDLTKSSIYLCEGCWDAMALWEVLANAKQLDGELVQTNNLSASLLSTANVLGIAGNLAFGENWCSLFGGKVVTLMAQNDHARKHPKTGQDIEPASYVGMQRIARMLAAGDTPPEEINLLHWGENGFDPTLPTGYDIRDAINVRG